MGQLSISEIATGEQIFFGQLNKDGFRGQLVEPSHGKAVILPLPDSILGNGTYFATMTTPDVYALFLDGLAEEYMQKEKLAKAMLIQKQEKISWLQISLGCQPVVLRGDRKDEMIDIAMMDIRRKIFRCIKIICKELSI